MFYDTFYKLCAEKGLSVSRVLLDLGMSKSTASTWKNKGYSPSKPAAKKIADYFEISVDALMSGETDQKEKPLVNNDEGLTEYLEELKNRPDKRMLFSVTKSATKAQIEAIVKMIEEMQGH